MLRALLYATISGSIGKRDRSSGGRCYIGDQEVIILKTDLSFDYCSSLDPSRNTL